MKMSVHWPKILLFGDSITQLSFEPGGWGASIANQVQRKCDIICRGFSGYNTKWALAALPHALPAEMLDGVVMATIFFGANDCCDPGLQADKHVPILDYVSNIKAMIKYFESKGLPKERLMLITPPPIDEAAWSEACKTKGTTLNRTLKNSGKYAKACCDLAQDLGVKVIDLWTLMQKEENWGPRFLCDGLHLTAEGAGFLYKHLSGFVDDCTASLPQQWPDWSSIDYANPEKSFQQD
ncbi:isoamyl acetate-hydrolyzing esterase 1 homolog isoform X1 [Diadema setosum]|uniref:isoamyl acetate-hydrolyzing esterase 1 homolog isoform X1 n=1 Tax=Diadema setosum TaxID=31175 RepID=UPI003B3BB402